MRAARAAVLASLALLASTTAARADEAPVEPGPEAGLEATTTTLEAASPAPASEADAEAGADAPPSSPAPDYHWDKGRPRFLVSTRLDIGALARAQLHAGYGRPYWLWAGVEAHALTTTEFGALYIGARASSPVLEASAGLRLNAAYRRGPLTPAARYDDAALEASDAPARYRAVDLDLYGIVPLGRLLVALELAATYLLRAGPRYDEWHRVVISARWLVVVRTAALVALDRRRRHRLGVLGEWLRDTGRGASTLRVGPAYHFAITPVVDLYLVGTLAPVSPDGLSAWNDLYGTATLRYRWASGDPSPPRIRDARGR